MSVTQCRAGPVQIIFPFRLAEPGGHSWLTLRQLLTVYPAVFTVYPAVWPRVVHGRVPRWCTGRWMGTMVGRVTGGWVLYLACLA